MFSCAAEVSQTIMIVKNYVIMFVNKDFFNSLSIQNGTPFITYFTSMICISEKNSIQWENVGQDLILLGTDWIVKIRSEMVVGRKKLKRKRD